MFKRPGDSSTRTLKQLAADVGSHLCIISKLR
jgi:hypothetical protein